MNFKRIFYDFFVFSMFSFYLVTSASYYFYNNPGLQKRLSNAKQLKLFQQYRDDFRRNGWRLYKRTDPMRLLSPKNFKEKYFKNGKSHRVIIPHGKILGQILTKTRWEVPAKQFKGGKMFY